MATTWLLIEGIQGNADVESDSEAELSRGASIPRGSQLQLPNVGCHWDSGDVFGLGIAVSS